jgi:RNA polymerase sigma-70 factor (ECF subfamily)
MAASEWQAHLSRIQTEWTRLLNPLEDTSKSLLLRYYGAAFRYLLALVQDAAVAEELAQEFAVRFLNGHYRNVHPERGRFRDFLKTSLRNLARNHWRKQQKDQQQIPAALDFDPAAPPDPKDDDGFVAGWRQELLERTWEALAGFEKATGKPYAALLTLKAEEPGLRAEELARRLAASSNKILSAEALRQTLHRARETFANLLLDEVQQTLPSSDRDQLAEELIELQLIDYCRQALKNRS